MTKTRKSYAAAFKLQVVEYSKNNGNRAAGRNFSINEKQVREWRKEEDILQQTKRTKKANRGNNSK